MEKKTNVKTQHTENEPKKECSNGKIAMWKMPKRNRRMIQQNDVLFLFVCFFSSFSAFFSGTMNICLTKVHAFTSEHIEYIEWKYEIVQKVTYKYLSVHRCCIVQHQMAKYIDHQWHLSIACSYHHSVPSDAIDH